MVEGHFESPSFKALRRKVSCYEDCKSLSEPMSALHGAG
ncbi:hypothetical protein FVEG_11113 [Fusarium verticillioides 7600]|uniref:Uncharacterized protein n=1 Tax=Gibberella moniliformis (strain M3125 / FGSC 7600) TaxID=334819 RepID=W7MX51_GIBM7|nr:hypothetical protein FVEG_11113 [Fusarium verticillioides 7600]EWG52340.1 hypothetical protein FVEG_11113 [Fusarium verticillioides 7600]